MFPNFLGFILLVCHKAHLNSPNAVEKPSVAICFVKNRIIPVLLTSSARHSQANNTGASPASPDNAWRVVSRQNRHQHTMGKCAKCGEKNHVTAVCKHVSKVRCRQCGELGHKEKHHTCD